MTREEAIEIVKKHGILADGTKLESALRELIPELAESEDEGAIDGMLEFFRYSYHCDDIDQKKLDLWIAYLEKQQESLHISETSKENANSFTDEDERIRRWLCDYFSSIDKAWIHKDITCIDILRWLEKQKEQKPAEWSEEDEEDVTINHQRFQSW